MILEETKEVVNVQFFIKKNTTRDPPGYRNYVLYICIDGQEDELVGGFTAKGCKEKLLDAFYRLMNND